MMNQLAYFWSVAGFMAGIAASIIALRLWSAASSPIAGSARGKLLIVAMVAAVGIGAFSLYAWVGRPELASKQAVVSGHGELTSADASVAGSMTDAVNRLVNKLSAGSGSDADWQLLQQSYEFVGDHEAALLAQQHQLKSDVNAQTSNAAVIADVVAPAETRVALAAYQQSVTRNPKDATAWLAIAQLQRTARNFPEAGVAFEHAVALNAMNADAWADYADVAASIAKSLANNTTRAALDAALKQAPRHGKALWLKASLAHEERRYADALKLWQQLRAAIADGSPDVTIIDANIQEARSLAAGVVVAQPANKPVAGVEVRGSVTLDPVLAAQVAGMTLFVYAKADDSPMPVAAYKTIITTLPVEFVLGDGQAMMPGRKLSQFNRVRVEARLSSSGQALAQPGDLQADAVTVTTHAAQPIVLRISKRKS